MKKNTLLAFATATLLAACGAQEEKAAETTQEPLTVVETVEVIEVQNEAGEVEAVIVEDVIDTVNAEGEVVAETVEVAVIKVEEAAAEANTTEAEVVE